MPSIPKSTVDLQRLMGTVNYLGKFIPKLSQLTSPLRDLLKKNIIFDLQQSQMTAIQEIKKLITSLPCLKYYHPNLPTRLKPDAEGLGALLEHNHNTEDCEQWFLTAFASRALNPYEKN